MSFGVWRTPKRGGIPPPWEPAPGFVERRPGVWAPEDWTPGPYQRDTPSVTTADEAIAEYDRCANNLPYFAFHHCWTVHVDDPSGSSPWRKVPYYPHLRRFFHAVQTPCNVHDEKSRQMFMTWAWMVVFLWDLNFHPRWENLVISRRATEVDDGGERSSANSLLGKIRYIWLSLPSYLQTPTSFMSGAIRCPELGSVIHGETGTAKAGRGSTMRRVLVDEAAYIERSEGVFKSVRQVAKNGTILQSTPNGTGNAFARIRFQKGSSFLKLCTPAETPIWMADETWRAIAEVRPGDPIIGWDDPVIGHGSTRTARPVTVTAVHHLAPRPVVKLHLQSGRTIRCTADHQWLQVHRTGPLAYGEARVGSRLAYVVTVTPPDRGRLAAVAGFVADHVERIEPDGVEPVYALTTSTGNYVAWGYASKNSFHWSEHPEKARGLYCTCGFVSVPGDVPPHVQFEQHDCGNLRRKEPTPPERRSPWYDRECGDLTPEQIGTELDISYERSVRGHVFEFFQSTRHVKDHTLIVDARTGRPLGERGEDERPSEYRKRYLRAALRPDRPVVCGWDFGVADPTSLVLGQVEDEDAMHIRWLDEYEQTGHSWSHYYSFVMGLWEPIVREVTGLSLMHYGDPSGKGRTSDLSSWVSNLASLSPPIVMVTKPVTGGVLEWLDFIRMLMLAPQTFSITTYAARTIDSLQQYRFPTDPDTGELIPGKQLPVHDQHSHGMSALRYVYMFRWPWRLRDRYQRQVGASAILAAGEDDRRETPPAAW